MRGTRSEQVGQAVPGVRGCQQVDCVRHGLTYKTDGFRAIAYAGDSSNSLSCHSNHLRSNCKWICFSPKRMYMAEAPQPTLNEDIPSTPVATVIGRNVVVDDVTYLRDGWSAVGANVILALIVYPTVLGMIGTILQVGAWAWQALTGDIPKWSNVHEVALIVVEMVVLGSLLSVVWFGIATLVVLSILHVVIWSLGIRPPYVILGAFAGGLVGFAGLIVVAVGVVQSLGSGVQPNPLFALFIGPGLATIMGQIGGAVGGRRAESDLRHRLAKLQTLTEAGWRPVTILETNESDRKHDAASPKFQFRIGQLLWASAWISGLLAVIRLTGTSFGVMLPVLLGWLVFQATTLWIGGRLVRRLGPWWLRHRQGRST